MLDVQVITCIFCIFFSDAGPDPNKPPCKKAKLLRMEKKARKVAQRGETAPPAKDKVQQLALTLLALGNGGHHLFDHG
jgi:hypothetical protein